MDKPTPRINSELKTQFVGRTVRVTGKIVSMSAGSAILSTTDHGQVMVYLNGESQWGTDYVEVIGQVEKDYAIREFKTTNLGNSFDLDLANKVVEFSQKCPEMFE